MPPLFIGEENRIKIPGFGLILACILFFSPFFYPELFGGTTNLENLVEKNPNDIRLQFLLGKSYSQKGNHLKAKSIFQDILQQRKAPIVFLHLGLEFAAMGNLTGAILQWTSVIEQKPNNVPAMQFLARALHKHALQLDDPSDQQDLFEQSLGWWKRILHLDPGNIRGRYFAGIEAYKLKRYEAAAKHWLILLRQKNNNLKVLKCLAKALVKAGAVDKSKRVALKMIRLEESKRQKQYTSWAQNLIQTIDNGDIKKPDVEEEISNLTQDEEKPHTIKKWDEPDPDDFTKPAEPRRRAPAPPPSIGPDPKFTIQAETLFLDGLDFKDSGQFEKALFAFLQAIDINPDFTQVFLQMGEVYIQLARIAKRESQFTERLSLSKQALEKVQEKSPGSLIAHAAQSKLVILKQLKRYGFKGYHLKTAHEAIKEKREDDAFDEYILILSNGIIEPGLFLEAGAIIPALSISNKQDLLFFSEDLYKKYNGNPWIAYLLGKLYLETKNEEKAEKAFNLFIENFNPNADKDIFALYIKFIDHPEVSATDSYLAAKLLLKVKENDAALKLLKNFLDKSKKGDLFYKEAVLIEEQLKRSTGNKKPVQGNSFSDQLKEITASVKDSRILFDNTDLNKAAIDLELLAKMEIFLQAAPDNNLARFIKAWILQIQSPKASADDSEEMRQKSEEIFYSLLSEKLTDPYWHFTMGIQALRWELKDRGMAHLKLVGDILLTQSMVHSNEFANMLIIEAEYFEVLNEQELVLSLLRQAKVYSNNSLNFYLTRAWIKLRQSDLIGAIGQLTDWITESFSRPWIRRLLLCDLGLILFLATMITILTTATALVMKYFEKLHHFFAEFISVKGIAITVGLGAMAAIFIFFFSSGLIVFLPLLLWPLMTSGERLCYVLLGTLLLFIPLLLPISFFNNFELIKQIEALQAGDLKSTSAFFTARSDEKPDDYALLFAKGILTLRQGELDSAEKIFTRLSKMRTDEGVIINLGVIEARRGRYDESIAFFQNALSIDAKSVSALFNIYSVYNFQGQNDKSEQYLRWAKKLASPKDQLERYLAVPSIVSKLPLMDRGPDTLLFDDHFSFFNSHNFFKLNANLLGFITWFFMGGGLVGMLLFVREQIDIISSHCSNCFIPTCNLCHHVLDNSVYCENCAEKHETLKDSREKKEKTQNAKSKKDFAVKKAACASIFLPGTGLLFIDSPILSTLCQLSFWTFVQGAMGGWLLPFIFPSGPGSDTLGIFSIALWTVALTIYLLSITLVYRQKESIEWI